jgi:hypothetical protein
MRLEDPHRAPVAIDGRGALSFVAVFARLPFPGFGAPGMPPDPVVKLASQSADHGLVPGVGEAQPAAAQPAEVPVRADQDTVLPIRAACTAATTPAEVPPTLRLMRSLTAPEVIRDVTAWNHDLNEPRNSA